MAKMHSRARGKSGSTKPIKKIPSWAPYKEKDVEKLVVKFAKAGKNNAEIGLLLRDSYGVHNVKALIGKNVSAIVQENHLQKKLPEDMLALIKKMILVKQHLGKNKQDKTALRGYQLTNSKVNRLVKYYKRSGKIAPDWKLDTDKLKMYLE
ncbi:30S ribosomal protein S15 [Candidatus Woesearchaeota archaeon]|nr:30S ribosomal protein S15 [Candidatus Woesearchaeota archaeon]